jgi:hypothetical protein
MVLVSNNAGPFLLAAEDRGAGCRDNHVEACIRVLGEALGKVPPALCKVPPAPDPLALARGWHVSNTHLYERQAPVIIYIHHVSIPAAKASGAAAANPSWHQRVCWGG